MPDSVMRVLYAPETLYPGTGGCVVAPDCLECPLPECQPVRRPPGPRPERLLKPDTPLRRYWREVQRRSRARTRERITEAV